jgi:hypothetical protein
MRVALLLLLRHPRQPTGRQYIIRRNPKTPGMVLYATNLYDECQKGSPSMDRIRQLVNTNPVKLRAVDGEIPLHAACRAFWNTRGGSVEAIQYLVEQWPESVKAVNINGILHATAGRHWKSCNTWSSNGPNRSKRSPIVAKYHCVTF